MKKTLLLLTGFAFATGLIAQVAVHNPDGSTFKQCSRFHISKSLRDINKEQQELVAKGVLPREAADSKAPRKGIHKEKNANGTPEGYDPARQTTDGVLNTHAPIVNVDGQQSLPGYIPLDPNGMVSPSYYVQAVNSNMAVYDKSGANILTPTLLSGLFGSWSCDDGDPVVMYDKFADRWVIEEFQENGACFSFGDAIDTMMFAVSTTNDPTGTYYIYNFCPDNTDFADYPKYTIWADGYYQTCNCQNDKVVVYDRTKMLAGNPAAGFIVVPFNNNPQNVGGQGGFFCPMTLYADGQLPPYGTPNYIFYFTDDNWGAGFIDAIVIDKISVNWIGNTGTITVDDTLPTAAFNSYFSAGSRQDIDQPGMNQSFDALDGFFSYRIPYLRFTGYNSAVMSHVVNVGTSKVSGSNMAGIRWYELRQDTTTKKWSIHQQSTYAPNDGVSRWNPAIAMDYNGDIGLAYSVSDPSTVYPGTRYTGRSACDALSTMTMSEGTAVSGSSDGSTYNRWGDYSHTSVDPSDGLTFWHTNMYIGGAGAVNTRIFSFKTPTCPLSVNSADEQAAQVTAYQSGGQLNIKAIGMPIGENTLVELFDMSGKTIVSTKLTPSTTAIETSLNISNLAKGIYLVRVGDQDMQKVIKVEIQ